jgi:hypothetical protein
LEAAARTFPFDYPRDERPDRAQALHRPDPIPGGRSVGRPVPARPSSAPGATPNRHDRHAGSTARDGARHQARAPLHAAGRAWRADAGGDAAARQGDVAATLLG